MLQLALIPVALNLLLPMSMCVHVPLATVGDYAESILMSAHLRLVLMEAHAHRALTHTHALVLLDTQILPLALASPSSMSAPLYHALMPVLVSTMPSRTLVFVRTGTAGTIVRLTLTSVARRRA